MIIVVGFQIMDTVNNTKYQADNEAARNQATADRTSLKNLINNNDVYTKQLGAYITSLIQNSTNQTTTLIKLLTDNFGANSGYIERENFQYNQANQTYMFLQQAIKNEEKIISNQGIIIGLLNKTLD